MSRWFRHYAGMMRDEKLVGVALRCKQPVERVIWVWGAILESAAEINDAGRYELDTAEVAYFLRADESDVVSIAAGLEGAGRLCKNRVVKWGDRQFQSDRSATRQKDYREREKAKRDGGGDEPKNAGDGQVTSPSRHSDAPETETELDTETERKKDIRAVASATRPDDRFDEFWKAYPKRDGANPKAPARKKFLAAIKSGVDPGGIIAAAKRSAEEARSKGQIGTPYVPQAMTWLGQQRWGDYEPQQETIERIGFYAAAASPELEAWDDYRQKLEGKTYPKDGKGGWTFPTQWPPAEDLTPLIKAGMA